MNPITSLLLAIGIASGVCSCHAASIGTPDYTLQSPHIVGSRLSEYRTRPSVFDLHLYKDKKFIRSCKGAELEALWITAAECLDVEKYDEMEVEHYLSGKIRRLSFPLRLIIYYRLIHPNYNNVTKENNIALLSPLMTRIGNDKTTRRIQLPNKNENFQQKTADVFLEWKNHTQAFDGSPSYKVHAVNTKVINAGWCKFWYRWTSNKDKYVCASGWYWKGLKKNDVGAPLIVRENDDSFKLVGIATTVRPWVHWFSLPMEFLNIAPYVSWIESYQNDFLPGLELINRSYESDYDGVI